MKSIGIAVVGLMGVCAIAGSVNNLKADDESDDMGGYAASGPKIQVSVTATGNARLHYRWRSSDGIIADVDASQTSWKLPSGPGLHFAYALVSDGMGGYSEGRISVNTDALGTPPQAATTQPRALVAPAAPARNGDTYRGILSLGRVPGCASFQFGCLTFARGVSVYVIDGFGARHPFSGSVNTDAHGYFSIPGVPNTTSLSVYCNADYSTNFTQCGNVGSQPTAYTNTSPIFPNTTYISGSATLADGSFCGIDNEFFGLHRSASAVLLDGSGSSLVTLP